MNETNAMIYDIFKKMPLKLKPAFLWYWLIHFLCESIYNSMHKRQISNIVNMREFVERKKGQIK